MDNRQNQQGQEPRQGKPRGVLFIFIMFFGLLLFAAWMLTDGSGNKVTWTKFLDNVRVGKVVKIKNGTTYIDVEAIKGENQRKYQVDYPGGRYNDSIAADLNEAIAVAAKQYSMQVVVDGDRVDGPLTSMLMNLLFFVALLVIFYFLFLRRMGGGGGVMSFGKSKAHLIGKGKTGKTFKDVAGVDECKEEVQELVEFLKNPSKFQRLGGRIPRGVLMVGPPGTGKTLLAKAIAGEADAPFYTISGSDFVEMFVGVGASRVRDLFQQAKENSPCIIFIDEIDAVARRRGGGMSTGGHDEREQTLNAILVEMDGFESNDKVIVIAATNRVDVLDPALTRPGRFDRHVNVDPPDINGREEILAVHSSKVKLSGDADLSIIARGTPGFSGADLESLINEAALHAARHNKDFVDLGDLEYARDRVAFGREKKGRSKAMSVEDKRDTAFHEAGHTVIQYLLPECDDLHKVSIIPRGRALGATMSLPSKDMFSYTRKRILGDMCVLFGGRIAEEMFCGDVSTGASNDIERATALARNMVYEWGLSDTMGPIKYTEEHPGLGGAEKHVTVSEETHQKLDNEVRSIIDSAYARAQDILKENAEAVQRITDALLEHESLDAKEVKVLMDGGNLPPRVSKTGRHEKKDPEGGAAATPAVDPKPDQDPPLQPSLA